MAAAFTSSVADGKVKKTARWDCRTVVLLGWWCVRQLSITIQVLLALSLPWLLHEAQVMKGQMPKRTFPVLLDAMTMRGGVCVCVCVCSPHGFGKVGIGGGMEETSVQHLQPTNRWAMERTGCTLQMGGSDRPSAIEARRVIGGEGWTGGARKNYTEGVPL